MQALRKQGREIMNTSHTLTNHAQRGTLTYMKPDYSFRTIEGWFYLNGSTVVMRKIGGRNESALCEESTVHDFELYDAEFAKFVRELNKIVNRTKAQ
jgi:hypothetical protein